MKRTRDSLKHDVSSSPLDGKKKTHVVIYYPRLYMHWNYSVSVVCIPIDSLISKPRLKTHKSALDKCCKTLPAKNFLNCSNTFCVSGPSLYVFGGFCPQQHVLIDKVHRYDLHTATGRRAKKCTSIPYVMYQLLVAQVGNDSLYFLGFDDIPEIVKLLDNNVVGGNCPKLIVNKYNFKTDDWKLVHGGDAIINKFDSDKFVRERIHDAPHVVIGNKFHVSFGGISFTLDTVNDVWEESKLFGTFWENNSPSNFHGGKLWGVGIYEERSGVVGGPPLGFYGRGIIWDNDILLGVHNSPVCPLIAYRLEDGIVVECQPFSFQQLGMKAKYMIRKNACLLDLGRDNYFGIVHFFQEDAGYGSDVYMELVTFKVSRPKQAASNGRFLKCEFVRKDIVADELRPNAHTDYYAIAV